MSRRVSAVPMLARRFLVSKASDGFLSMIAWVSICGVAVGVLALTVVTSVINGFEGELMRVITGMNGDVMMLSRGESIGDSAGVQARIRKAVPEVQAITPSFAFQLMIAGPHGVAGGGLEGFDIGTMGMVTDVPNRVIEGRLPEQSGEIALGSSLSERIGAPAGTEVRLIAPFAGGEESGTPKVMQAKVVGIVRMGMYEYDSKFVFSPLPAVQEFLNEKDRVNTFKIRLSPGADSPQAAEQLSGAFGYPFRAKDWAQLNKNLLYAIKLEKVVIAIILTIIVIVAAFNVVSTLMMMIHDKTKEIAILKAMGLRPYQSFGLFCMIGLGMGVVGTVVGVSGGLLLNFILERTRLIDLPPDIYYISFLPVVIRWQEVALIATVAVSISFLATLYPAWKVTRRSPLEGLRYD
ncbi:MAG TPA: lipoprotein-releasing system transmembrane subunit LolC [Bdellovibrionales bacterium]|nr:lipoprotein-releasing system transmembrane subunit LolC [Bdellovibrionales bacterium]